MPSVQALAAKSVKTGQLTEDNKTIVFELEAASGPTAVAVPVSESRKLLQILLTMIARSERATKGNASLKYPIAADYWEVGTADDGDLVLTFVPPTSAELSFKVKRKSAAELAKVLTDAVKK